MRICKVIFSTNRLEYLIPTLESYHKNLDFGDHEVHGIFIDDYPKGRNNGFIESLARKYGYNHVVLHKENLGISNTWGELYRILSNYQFDYIWQQEDDVLLLQPTKIDDLISILHSNTDICSVSLRRYPWYPAETLELIREDDVIIGNYRYNKEDIVFSPISGLYEYWVTQVPYVQISGMQPSEGIIMHILREQSNWQRFSAIVKSADGMPLINHIGEITQGKRVNPGELGWQQFAGFDPNKQYYSRSGQEVYNGQV